MIRFSECSFFLSPTDLGRINQLLKQLSPKAPALNKDAIRLVQQRGFIFTARDMERIDHMSDNGTIVGLATLMLVPRRTGTVAYVEDFVVDSEYHRRGVGRGLFEKLFTLAQERHATHIDLTCNPARAEANFFYQNLGFELRVTNNYRMVLDSA